MLDFKLKGTILEEPTIKTVDVGTQSVFMKVSMTGKQYDGSVRDSTVLIVITGPESAFNEDELSIFTVNDSITIKSTAYNIAADHDGNVKFYLSYDEAVLMKIPKTS